MSPTRAEKCFDMESQAIPISRVKIYMIVNRAIPGGTGRQSLTEPAEKY